MSFGRVVLLGLERSGEGRVLRPLGTPSSSGVGPVIGRTSVPFLPLVGRTLTGRVPVGEGVTGTQWSVVHSP